MRGDITRAQQAVSSGADINSRDVVSNAAVILDVDLIRSYNSIYQCNVYLYDDAVLSIHCLSVLYQPANCGKCILYCRGLLTN